MGDLWRSEPMELVQLFVHRDAAHETFDELGDVGLIQFHDVCDLPPPLLLLLMPTQFQCCLTCSSSSSSSSVVAG